LLFTLLSSVTGRVDCREFAAIEAGGVMKIANERRTAVNTVDRLGAKAGADLFMNFKSDYGRWVGTRCGTQGSRKFGVDSAIRSERKSRTLMNLSRS
jgi:hypothetical protein